MSLAAQILSTHREDPHNARYLSPLAGEDEAIAQSMAAAVFGALAEKFAADITADECDRVYEQALVDCRRMVCDREYAGIFRE